MMPSASSPLSLSFEPQRARAPEPPGAIVVRFPRRSSVEPWALRLDGRQVSCGARTLDLAGSPSMLALFRAFFDGVEPVVRRETLLYLIYGRQFIMGCSERNLQSKRANVIKLMSRARLLAAEHLSGPHGALVEWFPYDRRTNSWHLIGLTRSWEGDNP